MTKAYVFLVGYNESGPYADCFLDVSAAIDQSAETYQRAVDTAKRIGADASKLEKLPQDMAGISLRARVTNRRLHKVTTEEPLTVDELEALLFSKLMDKTLQQFLKESAI